ncbi:MAG: LytTR family DNA-binding domain-containing protein [Bacteroidia bacterium]|nr:LytTR family DNA-binding domain-containing protein [Bacteroidia bacterium]
MNTKIKSIIIEDEEPARDLIKNYLSEYNEIEIAGEFADGFSGLKAINEMKPDLVFLDIQMPKLTGFEVLELAEHHPIIIFITAFDQYAIQAFEASAVDYLLKPYSRERFLTALTKAKEKFTNLAKNESQIKSVLQTIDDKPETIDRIAVRTGRKINVIPSGDIIYLEADGDYVKIHTGSGSYLKEKTMKFFESHLDPGKFIRIHRSYIANIDFIQRLEYYDKENYAAILKNNHHLKVSSSGYKLLRSALNLD